jgi:hexosaminidase
VNVAEGKSYTMLKQPEGNYPDEKGNAFTDGKLGEPTYGDAAWSGFLGKPEFVIDLGEKVNGIYSVRLNTLGGGNAAIYAPNQVTIYVSDDGENFTQVASKTFAADVNAGSLNVVVRNVTLPEDASARYVKIAVATNQSWIFIDEISVYAE